MPQPVFISYARDASRAQAEALHEALGGRTAFLDTVGIEPGERFPEALVDALFDAKVVVIFAEPHYFTRWYCLLEFRIARTPFLRMAERPGVTAKEKEDALRGLVVAMPPRGVDAMMERFPPLVQARNWPAVDDIEAIAALVEAELAADPPTLRERYAAVVNADEARAFLLEATRLPPPQRIGNIPFVPQVGLAPTIADAFVGRADDLWRIHDLLWTERGDPATAAGLTGSIEAIGGFGKTRLALEYLYRFGPRHFKGGLFWVNAESDAELQLYDVLQALNPSAPDITIVRQGSGGVPGAVARAIRTRPDHAPTPLFIIDNVPETEPGQRPRPLATWCPVIGEVPVLTTSRTRVALGTGGGVVPLPIDTLRPDAAVELLAAGTPRKAITKAEWEHIAEWVGHLPLALEILNRLLRSGAMTPRVLLDLSHAERPGAAVDQAMESIRYVVPEGALRGISEAFSASYDLLTPEEQYAARLIAWMAPAPIPTFVLDAFGPAVFAPGFRAKLRNRSFVTDVSDGAGSCFGVMHRVLADFVRARAERPDEDAETVGSLLAGLMRSQEGHGKAGAAVVRDCAAVAISVFANWPAILAAHTRPAMCSLGSAVGIMLAEWGHPAFAGEIFTLLVSQSERWLSAEDPEYLAFLRNLANTRRARGDYAGAQELHERVLRARERILGDEHPDTLLSMISIANLRRDRGDYTGAEELEQRALQTARRVLGDEHPTTLLALNNLANTRNYLGNLAGAQQLQELALQTRRRLLGDEHRDTLISLTNLAITLANRGNLAEARALQQQACDGWIRTFGDEHPNTLDALHNLANTLAELGEFAEARNIHERILATRRDVLGVEHPDTLRSLNDIAALRRDLGDLAGAEELQQQVLDGRRRILGDEHPYTLTAMHNLALTRSDRGNYTGAQALQETVLEAMRRTIGGEHPNTLSAMHNLALTLKRRGKHVGAQELQEHVLEARRRTLGDAHPDTISSMASLAKTRSALGDREGARELQEYALRATRQIFGPEHPETTDAACDLLETYIAESDMDSIDRLMRDHLLWLADHDPSSLTEQQQRIQIALREKREPRPRM
ncbi:MAG TPA: toll/interleukin-1 receptor domain-containing protein [Longimicrobium sp.]|nr:toll/interleukin-1 receptor domain-containing protein [Longimicrobium sp.]